MRGIAKTFELFWSMKTHTKREREKHINKTNNGGKKKLFDTIMSNAWIDAAFIMLNFEVETELGDFVHEKYI